MYTLIVCLSVRLYPINVKTAEPIYRAHIFCGTSHYPRKGLCMLRITKISLQKLFEKPQKILFNPRTCCVIDYCLYCTKRKCQPQLKVEIADINLTFFYVF